MIINKYETEEDWLADRNARITGSRVKEIIPKKGDAKKLGYYELIAEGVCIPSEEENPMLRGVRLEDEAMARFAKETGKDVNTDLVMWQREDNPKIAFSPDGSVGETEVIDAKCKDSARHIKAYLTQEVPSEHMDQVIQAFCVNDLLTTFYLVFYDPRIPTKDFFYLTIHRKDVQAKVDEYLNYQRNILVEIEKIIKQLTF